MITFILKIFIVLFAVVAIFLGFFANTARQLDIEQHAAIERAIELTDWRVSQAHELFVEIRPYLDVLAGSEELRSREVFFVPGLLYVPEDDLLIWRSEWDDTPWLSPDEVYAVNALFQKDIEGARDRVINFSESGMTATIFGLPLHAHDARAWLGFTYRDTVVFPELYVVRTEALDDDWYLSTTAFIHVNTFPPLLIATLLAALASLATLGILLWGIKTERFI